MRGAGPPPGGRRPDNAALTDRDREIELKQRLIDKITHEMAVLKRLKFAAQSERFAPE